MNSVIVLAIVGTGIFQHTGNNENLRWQNDALPQAAYSQSSLYSFGIPGTGIYEFSGPYGVVVNATGHLYVGDCNAHRVQVYDKAGIYQYTIGETSVPGPDNAHLNRTSGVAVNSTGHLYVADRDNERVQVFDNAGNYQYTIGVTMVRGSDNAHFIAPMAVAINSSGHVFVCDYGNDRVQVFDNTGHYVHTISSGLAYTCGCAVNITDNLYVADTSRHCIRVFDNAGNSLYVIGEEMVSGNDDTHFNFPYGVAVDALGTVYVADSSNNRVQVFDNAGHYQYTLSGFGHPEGVATNATGHLYVSDDYNGAIKVYEIPAPTGQTITINGGAANTVTLTVSLTLSATEATEMCFSNNGTTYTAWEAYSTSKAWVLTDGLGPKTVFFKTRCELSEAAPISGTITYTLPPTGLSVTINSGAAETNTTGITLSLSATGATEMCFSNDGVTWSAWEPFATSKQWTLTDEVGAKIVYFKARNGTIEAVNPVSDTITYTPPNGVPGFPLVVLLAAIGLGTLSILRRTQRIPRE